MSRFRPREIRFAEIEQMFTLHSFWQGETWMPAVARRPDGGYGIRVVKSPTAFDHFHLDDDGTVTSAPVGYAKVFRPGRVVDVEAALERYATPDGAEGGNVTDGGAS